MEVWALPPPRGPFTWGSQSVPGEASGEGPARCSGPRGHATCRPFPAAAVPPAPGWGQGPAADGSHGVISPKGQDGPRGGRRREGGRRSRDHCRKRGREQAGIELQKLQRREGVLGLLGRPCGCDPPTPRALSQHVHCPPPLPALPAPPGTRSPRRLPGQPDCRSTDRTRTGKGFRPGSIQSLLTLTGPEVAPTRASFKRFSDNTNTFRQFSALLIPKSQYFLYCNPPCS